MRSRDIPHDLAKSLSEIGISVGDLVFYINSNCNLRCRHCYIGNSLLDSELYYSADSIIKTLISFPHLSRLTILGGEPTRHPEFRHVFQTAAALPITEKRLSTNLTTAEGWLFEIAKAGNFILAVSLDGGNGREHDFIRGSGTFERTKRNIKSAVDMGSDVEVTITITDLTAPRLIDILKSITELGVKRINLHSLSNVGNAAGSKELRLTPSIWRRAIDSLAPFEDQTSEIIIRFELAYVTTEELRELVALGYRPHATGSYYSVGKKRIVIYPDQRIYISSEAFGTNHYIADISGAKTLINSHFDSELRLAESASFSVSDLQPSRSGDGNFPFALSVSFRRMLRVRL